MEGDYTQKGCECGRDLTHSKSDMQLRTRDCSTSPSSVTVRQVPGRSRSECTMPPLSSTTGKIWMTERISFKTMVQMCKPASHLPWPGQSKAIIVTAPI